MNLKSSQTTNDHLEIHIDETGDRGMKPGSSPYFFMTACAFRASNRHLLKTAMKDLNMVLGRPPGQFMHSADHLKSHEKLIEAAERLAAINEIRLFFVIIPKNSITQYTPMRGDTTYMYNYTSRLMLELISWFAHSMRLSAHPTFASVKRLPRTNLDKYISLLHTNNVENIVWKRLKLPVSVVQANERIGIQWADIAGRTLLKALVPSATPPHRIEPMYLKTLAPVIWGERPLESYGLKCIEPNWHEEISWWSELSDLVPNHNLLD